VNGTVDLLRPEIGARLDVLAAEIDWCGKQYLVRSGGRLRAVAVHASDPGNYSSVFKAYGQLHLHGHATAQATNEPDYILPLTAPVHAIDNKHGSFRRGGFSLEDKGAFAVTIAWFWDGRLWERFSSGRPLRFLRAPRSKLRNQSAEDRASQ
jgi:hypothetical protein